MGRRGSATMLALICASLAAGTAMGASTEGTLVVESGASFPQGTDAEVVPWVVLLRENRTPGAFSLTAPRLTVHVYESRMVEVGRVAASQYALKVESWSLTDVVLTSGEGEGRAGHVALEPRRGDSLRLAANGRTVVEDRLLTTLASDDSAHTPDEAHNPREMWYVRTIAGDHIRVAASGTLEGTEIGGVVRVQGKDILLHARENTTRIQTGEFRPSTAQAVLRWVYLSFDDADLRIESPAAPFTIAASQAPRVSWAGPARVTTVDGSLRAGDVEYASLGPAELDGDLATAIYPFPGEPRLLRLAAIRGDLASTTMTAHPLPAPVAAPPAPSWLAAAFVFGVVASASAAGGTLVWRRVRARLRPASMDELRDASLAWASFFEEREDPAAALECLRHARSLADEDEHDLVLWEASCLDRLGLLEEALATYEAAVAVAPRGECEAAFSAAILAGQLTRHDVALVHLRLSLMADPYLAEVVDAFRESEDDPFGGLRRLPEFRGLMREAREWARAAGGPKE